MDKYKLVPVEPTPEMWAAAGDAVVALNSQHHDAISEAVYKAMLAAAPAAPAVHGEPVAWIVRHPHFCGKFTDDKEIAEHWENKEQGCTAPLFLHPQPAPDFAKLVEALEGLLAITDESLGVSGCHLNGDIAKWCEFEDVAMAEEALAAYRKQGEE